MAVDCWIRDGKVTTVEEGVEKAGRIMVVRGVAVVLLWRTRGFDVFTCCVGAGVGFTDAVVLEVTSVGGNDRRDVNSSTLAVSMARYAIITLLASRTGTRWRVSIELRCELKPPVT